jgi:hypothetical protein
MVEYTPFGQSNEFFDPSVPDITGRVMECFGLLLAESDAFYSKTGKKLVTEELRTRHHTLFLPKLAWELLMVSVVPKGRNYRLMWVSCVPQKHIVVFLMGSLRYHSA